VVVFSTPTGTRFADMAELERLTEEPVRWEYRMPGTGSRTPPADVVLACPLSFNSVNKFAHGHADNFAVGLLCEMVGYGVPVVVVPHCKPQLASHPAFGASLETLHVADHGTTPDGYLFQGRKYKLVVRRSYQQDFQRAAARAGLPPDFIPHSLRHLYASVALAEGIPITEVSRWLGHRSIEVTHQIYGHLVPNSLGRARTALDHAYQKNRRQPPRRHMN
jgi:hypothetical protein